MPVNINNAEKVLIFESGGGAKKVRLAAHFIHFPFI
jgi:hypothetical protein